MFSQQLSSNLRSFVPNDSLEERTTHTHTHTNTQSFSQWRHSGWADCYLGYRALLNPADQIEGCVSSHICSLMFLYKQGSVCVCGCVCGVRQG